MSLFRKSTIAGPCKKNNQLEIKGHHGGSCVWGVVTSRRARGCFLGLQPRCGCADGCFTRQALLGRRGARSSCLVAAGALPLRRSWEAETGSELTSFSFVLRTHSLLALEYQRASRARKRQLPSPPRPLRLPPPFLPVSSPSKPP